VAANEEAGARHGKAAPEATVFGGRCSCNSRFIDNKFRGALIRQGITRTPPKPSTFEILAMRFLIFP
jgi:hypothetical protein